MEAFRLFALVVLPTVLLEMVFVPWVTWMPVMEAEMAEVAPMVVIEPMVLLLMATEAPLVEPIPKAVPPEPEVTTEINPVPLPLPIVLPVTVPMFAAPVSTWIPDQTPG